MRHRLSPKKPAPDPPTRCMPSPLARSRLPLMLGTRDRPATMMNLDEAADQLYGSSLDDFVSERTRLVKELRATGEAEEAATLAKSRKPTVAAWVLNQLARRNRRDIDLLLDAGHRLRDAQAEALTGEEKGEFERARKTERDALRSLNREAERFLTAERGGACASGLNQ